MSSDDYLSTRKHTSNKDFSPIQAGKSEIAKTSINYGFKDIMSEKEEMEQKYLKIKTQITLNRTIEFSSQNYKIEKINEQKS